MWLVPYKGARRTFSTTLSTQSCRQRLHSELASPAQQRAFGWGTLTSDPDVLCHVDGSQFRLYRLSSNKRWGPWYLYNAAHHDEMGTIITSQYRTPWYVVIGWLVCLGLSFVYAGWIAYTLYLEVIIANQSIADEGRLLFLIMSVGWFFLIPVYIFRNREAQRDEQYLIALLRRLFEADERL